MTYFGPEKLRGRILVCVMRRHMDEAIDVIFRHSFGYALSTFDMNIFQIKVSGSVSECTGIRVDWALLRRIVSSD